MKTARRPHLLRLASASLMILCAACVGARPPAPDPAATAKLWQQIQAENANPACDSDNQCHSLGAGSKACGGPETYLAWSSKQGDGARLKALVEQHSAARRVDDAREHMMSTCSVISDPGAVCRAGRCVLNRGASAAPGAASNQQ